MMYKYRSLFFFAQEIETNAYNVYICNHGGDTALGPDLPAGNIRVLVWQKKGRNRAKSLLELSKSFIEEDEFLFELSKSIFEASELSV